MARRTRARLARVLRCQGEIVETPLGRPESTAGAQRVLYQHGHPRLYSVTDCPAKEGVVGTQKVRLAAWQEQVIAMSGDTEVYVLDEPTSGLHMHDIDNLIGPPGPAGRERAHGNRHNLDAVARADWVGTSWGCGA
jgi:hypothetical protein